MDDDISLALSFAGGAPPAAPPGPQGPPPDPVGQVGAWARTAPASQRAAAAEKLGHLAEISAAIGSRSPDPQVRLSLARHMAALHPQYGVDPSGLDASQFTDAAMRAQFAQQLAARALLQRGLPAPPSYPATPSNWEMIR
jgi:hypothetical protein